MITDAQRCAALATQRAEAPEGTEISTVWNGLSLADQNMIRRDLRLPPLRAKSRIK